MMGNGEAMMDAEEYFALKMKIQNSEYAWDLEWIQHIEPCRDAWKFATEAMWVIVSSGIKNQVAREIESRLYYALSVGESASETFGHKGKAAAIDYVISNQEHLFKQFQEAENKVEYLQSLPWIGPITKYHLAKNLGIDTCKPDRHLVRIAAMYETDPFTLCKKLSQKTGDKMALVDMVLWRAANLGMI